jgi:hypothetical protein
MLFVRAHLGAIQLNDFPQKPWKAYAGAQLNFAVMSEMHALIINVPARAQELSESIETRAHSALAVSRAAAAAPWQNEGCFTGCGAIVKHKS